MTTHAKDKPIDVPVVTVIGSCRVYDPCKMLQDLRFICLNQQNIFGFVHNSREVLQQLEFVSGAKKPPLRLRPFLNIGEDWVWPEGSTQAGLDELFSKTDVFVVEISSTRLIQFKAMFLQLNRTRELLAADEVTAESWWAPLLRTGENLWTETQTGHLPPVYREVVEGLTCREQSASALLADLAAITAALKKPVLFVTHFAATAGGHPIQKRQATNDVFRTAKEKLAIAVWDPTAAVLAEGAGRALLDGAHYNQAFKLKVAADLFSEISALREQARSSMVTTSPFASEMAASA